MTRLGFGLCALPFVVLCTLNAATYRYGASDQAFYLPAVLLDLHPRLFPKDASLLLSQARLTLTDEAFAALASLTGAPLPALFAALYVVSLLVLAAAAALIGARLYRSPWTSVALLAALTLRHAVSRTGANTLEGYFHPRILAFGLGALALAALLRGRLWPAVIAVLLSGVVHPTTGLWFAIWVAVAVAVSRPAARIPLAVAAVAAAAAAGWALAAGPMAGRLGRMDPEWLATLEGKDYLFPLQWPLQVWLFNLVYAPVILWGYLRRRSAGLTGDVETGIVAGCLALLLVFCAALPLNALRIAIAVQLQIPRTFWMLDFAATLYLVWLLAEDTRSPAATRPRVVAAVVVVATLARGTYVGLVRFPDRALAQIDVRDDDWGRVMRWARTTDPGSAWLADPMHAVKYGTSVRAAGERDVLVEAVKDAAIGMYERDVAMRTRERVTAAGDFGRLTAEHARTLGAAYGLDYLVIDRPLDLPQAFQSGALRVYRLR